MSKYGQALRERAAPLLALDPQPLLEQLMGIPDGRVYCRVFDVQAHARYQDLLARDDADAYARMVAELALDADGNRLFDIGDVPVFLERLPYALLSSVAIAIVGANGRVVSDPLASTSEAPASNSPVVSAVPSTA